MDNLLNDQSMEPLEQSQAQPASAPVQTFTPSQLPAQLASPNNPPIEPPKKKTKWWLWPLIAVGIIVFVFIILAIIGAQKMANQNDQEVADITNYLNSVEQTDELGTFAGEIMSKAQANDLAGIKALLSDDYFEKYANEDNDNYLAKVCGYFAKAEIGSGGPNVISSTNEKNQPQFVYQKKATIDGEPYILMLVVTKEGDEMRLLDISLKSDPNPDTWID